MRALAEFPEINLFIEPIDFRRGKDFMASLAGQAIYRGTLFAFTNRRRDRIRCLYWDTTGYAMWTKWLDRERFKWPTRRQSNPMVVSSEQLRWLLAGLNIEKMRGHEKVEPKYPS